MAGNLRRRQVMYPENHLNISSQANHFLEKILFIFRETGKEREKEGKENQHVVASHMPPAGDLACNPGMCPKWESKTWPLGSQAGPQSTEPHQPGHQARVFYKEKKRVGKGFGI